ncbi:cellulase family glycosylhydrolase [Nocardiopsis sp. HNM0947]|uniref:Cellulase family glycosylhydrolase n=1 Tax=Nocardiopsis coralli TaxID=2772213 RepID=A0ABR9P554_9ACTN|nr:glycoside hydrolase family 5 protein [Nocardiopsis coralli]MBE2998951.1 cellulase family glycosylhydrolase [Nocardiopsis coralli]
MAFAVLTAMAIAVPPAVASASNSEEADTAAQGIHVSDGRLVESDGSDLVLRGINHGHAWYPEEVSSFEGIASTGANSVRVVLSSGDQWERNDPSDVTDVVERCDANQLVCMLEVHDTTGYGDTADAPDAVSLDEAVDYWEELYPTLAGTEDRVIVNIGNEPFGNDRASEWADDTAAAIERLRDIGYEHTIVADAPNWGQDWSDTMREEAPEVAEADPDGNTVFSVHMYEVYGEADAVTSYLEDFVDAGLPLIVGEFGDQHYGEDVNEDAILAESQRLGIGWLGWSWSGNGDGVEYLDLVNDFDASSPTAWGERLIDGPDGIRETSEAASVFQD